MYNINTSEVNPIAFGLRASNVPITTAINVFINKTEAKATHWALTRFYLLSTKLTEKLPAG